MVVVEEISRIFKHLGVPASRIVSNEKADTFVVFRILDAEPIGYSEDGYHFLKYNFEVNLYSRTDYDALLDRIIISLRKNGFTIDGIGNENYDPDRGYFLIQLRVSIMED